MQFERSNPLTGEVASNAPAMQVSDLAAIGVSAQQGFAEWSAMGPNARRAVLMKAADALEAKQQDFVAAMAAEIGATPGWAMFNHGLA
ncbi:MAG: aldehyde dehydrogenase family protein, partial [Marinomonas sp.]